jgi:hypothetical protein
MFLFRMTSGYYCGVGGVDVGAVPPYGDACAELRKSNLSPSKGVHSVRIR